MKFAFVLALLFATSSAFAVNKQSLQTVEELDLVFNRSYDASMFCLEQMQLAVTIKMRDDVFKSVVKQIDYSCTKAVVGAYIAANSSKYSVSDFISKSDARTKQAQQIDLVTLKFLEFREALGAVYFPEFTNYRAIIDRINKNNTEGNLFI